MKYCNRIIEYSFYALFILVPVAFSQYTSELFELNKMWITFALTVTITAAWIIKMLAYKKFLFRRTFFDLPILLFLISQLLSTLISLDPHISWWGYYSRFNGGFYSTICYVILFYAFLTNLEFKEMKNSLYISLITGIGVALWGLPAHFGKDPTCLLFRGTFDTSCWTEAFQPTVRIFSTLGQPAWMAAYLAFLIPLATAFSLNHFSSNDSIAKNGKNYKLRATYYVLLSTLFYLCLIFANTRAGFIAFWIGNIIFWGVLLLNSDLFKGKKLLNKNVWLKYALLINIIFLLTNFLFGVPLSGFDRFTLNGIKNNFNSHPTPTTQQITDPTPTSSSTNPEIGASGINITDSGKIRQIVWTGAIDAWKKSPILGTGVETFAFAYYQNRPSEHNLTSEWDFLYNKAHNEYLNYLTTTGVLGLGSYLLFISFTFYFFIILLREKDSTTPENKKMMLLSIGLFAGWTTILISNFFGFSVVIINIFFFLTPAFLLLLYTQIRPENKYLKLTPTAPTVKDYDAFQWTGIIIAIIVAIYILLKLLTYWNADKAYALGFNLNRVGEYEQAYNKLTESVTLRPSEPVFKDELALNLATIATALSLQNGDPATATQAAQQAIALSNETTTNFPNNIVFWKNRVKIFFLLNQSTIQGKETFNELALHALQKTNSLAPTDAKVMYNLGSILLKKDLNSAIMILEETVKQKPNYTDAYRDLGKAYIEAADQTDNTSQKNEFLAKAKAALEKVVILNPDDKESKNLLQTLK